MQSESVQTALASLARAVAGENGAGDASDGVRTDTPPSAPSREPSSAEAREAAGTIQAQIGLPTNGSQTFFTTELLLTRLSARNDGSQYGEARVQTVFGADPEYLPLSPGETKSVTRWWGGVPIRVTNNANSPLTVWTG
ncbi:hypothetical protein [Streptomyces sp. Agncl-13]|uniref:hypothetical protein n=1 Tax=Streptomyces sp. Agncl-13 TaxID=3400628 RepID=UPI003A859DAC